MTGEIRSVVKIGPWTERLSRSKYILGNNGTRELPRNYGILGMEFE
jgi:hypothetical protein